MRAEIGSSRLAFIGSGTIALLLGALLLSGATSALVAARRLMQSDLAGLLAGAGTLGLLALALWRAARVPAATSDRWFLIGWALAPALARILIWLLASGYEQAGDCRFMLDAIRLIARDGFGDTVMLQLAGRYYDDYLWAGRSIPFLFPLAKLWPGHEVATARVLNLLLSALHNLLVYALCMRIAGRRSARIAYALVALIPIHSWLILDYTHQYFGAFLVMAGVYLLARAPVGAATTSVGWIRDGLLFGLVLCALHVQSGIDKFMVVIALFAAVLWALAAGVRDRRFVRCLSALAAAALLFAPVSTAFTTWLNQYRPHRMSSHPISFTARGWNLVTWGEYYGVYEQIDRETPWPEKPVAMKALILSQMAHEPAKTLIALPMVKVAKYFLIGYATAIEQQLDDAGYPRMRQVFRGMRVAFAPAFLLLCALGLWRMLRSESARDPMRVLVAAVPLIFCAVYVIAGETSPRYSFHIHGLLAILGALAWAESPPQRSTWNALQAAAGWWGAVLLTLAVAALVVPLVIRRAAADRLFVNLKAHQDGVCHLEGSEPTVFTARIASREDGEARGAPLVAPAGAARVSFFLWPIDREALRGGSIALVQEDRVLWEREAGGIPHVMRVEIPLDSRAPFAVWITGASGTAQTPLLRWGYVRFGR